MEKQTIAQPRKRKHKSAFYVFSRTQGKILKPRRLSCMGPSELLQMEESKVQIVNILIDQFLSQVFDAIDQAKAISQRCTLELQDKVSLVNNFEFYNMAMMPEQLGTQISLQQQPKTQFKLKVIRQKDKSEQKASDILAKDLIINQLNRTNSSNSKNKFISKQKLLKITSTLAPNHSNKSIRSNKSNIINPHSISSYRLPKSIEEEGQHEKQKQRKQREEIVKRLMKQYQSKLKENKYFCPAPLTQDYRSFFIQPETKEQKDLRTSFLHLRQLKEGQQKLSRHKSYKKTSSSMVVGEMTNKETTRTTKLPTIYKSGKQNKKQESSSLFAQDENGQIIKIKNNQRVDSQSRDYSFTTHESFHSKPRETPFKEVSNTFKQNYEYLKNDKIKDENTLLNQNASLISTLCQSMDEQMMEKSLLENFVQKKGVILKKATFTHRSSMSVELQALKLPSILVKKR